MDKIRKTLGEFAVALLCAAGLIFLKGIILVDLWEWFIIPIFNVKPLTFLSALGLTMFVSFTTSKGYKKKDKSIQGNITSIAKWGLNNALYMLTAWGLAWIILVNL